MEALPIEVGAGEHQVLDPVAGDVVPVEVGGRAAGGGDHVPGGLRQRGQPGPGVLDRHDAGDRVPGEQAIWPADQPEPPAGAH
ncbi:hypothetical protein GCM10027612_07550 [Microbispora bryophytorum subsp. camponoti]